MAHSASLAGRHRLGDSRDHRLVVACALALALLGVGQDRAHAALVPLDAFGGADAGAARLAGSASGVALAPSGRVYVADTRNHRVQSFTAAGVPAGAITGTGAGRARLNRPVGVAVDGAGRVYVTEALGDRLHRFTADGTAIDTFGGHGDRRLGDPRGVAVARDGAVLVVDAADARVEVFAPSGAVLGSWGSRGSGPGQFADPHGIAVAPGGDVYVTDRAAGRVLRFSPAGVHLGSFDGRGTPAGALVEPTGITVDRTGAVHVADTGRGRVLTFTGDGAAPGPGTAVPSSDLAGLASDCRSSVYVVDAGAGLVRRLGRAGATPPPCAPPTAAFTATPGVVPLRTPVAFDASGSRDDGRITRWDWDLDGDGTFEAGDRGPTPTRSFDRPGTVAIGLRVTDDDGEQAEATQVVTVVAPLVLPLAEPVIAPDLLAVTAPPEPVPLLGTTMRAETTQGTVTFRRPGATSALVLSGRPLLPVGTRLDTTAGRVRLTLAVDRGATTQSGTFWGGVFTPLQGTASPLTELVLADAPIARRATLRAAAVRAAPARRRSRLWGDAKGSFRTTGRNAVATVRGTRWLTEDDDAGTTVRVVSGVVRVRDLVAARTVDLRAGQRYVARDACESRRSFRIRLRVPVGVRVRTATVTANERRVPVRTRDGRLTALIDFRGRAEGAQLVRISLMTTRGVRLVGTRSYRTCAGRLAGGAAPAL